MTSQDNVEMKNNTTHVFLLYALPVLSTYLVGLINKLYKYIQPGLARLTYLKQPCLISCT